MKLSVVIPSYRDPLLIKTIDDLLANSELGKDLEIIVVIDGYEPSFELRQDPHVRYIKLGRNRGMRGAINAGVDIARGEFVARSDEHIMFSPGYDRVLTETCQPDWIVTGRRFFLDPAKWEIMADLPPIDYEKLVIQKDDQGNDVKFAGQRWDSRTQERKDIAIDENMAMQGSFWCMPHAWWNKVIGELQTEGFGPSYQDSHEMVFKTWKAGGKFMLNKGMWYGHKHRNFPRTHQEGSPENPSNREASWAYSLSIWKDYYIKEIKPKWGI